MDFKLINESVNGKGVREISYLFHQNPDIDSETYSKKYDENLLSFIFQDEALYYILYFDKFPSSVTKVRSFKGLLRPYKSANFEKKISKKESYLGFVLRLDELNREMIFNYLFSPNNCCLIKTQNSKLEEKIKENIFKINFYDNINSFWIDYYKLALLLKENSWVYHFHVNPFDENEFGVKVYSVVS